MRHIPGIDEVSRWQVQPCSIQRDVLAAGPGLGDGADPARELPAPHMPSFTSAASASAGPEPWRSLRPGSPSLSSQGRCCAVRSERKPARADLVVRHGDGLLHGADSDGWCFRIGSKLACRHSPPASLFAVLDTNQSRAPVPQYPRTRVPACNPSSPAERWRNRSSRPSLSPSSAVASRQWVIRFGAPICMTG